MRVVLVIVTFNRSSVLAETLRASAGQTRPPDAVLVVDNGSRDDTVEMITRDFPEVEVLEAGDNIGYGAGLALGMRKTAGRNFDAYWLMDDDSAPEPQALAALLRAVKAAPSAAVLALRGGSFTGGWVRHLKQPSEVRRFPELGSGIHALHFCLADGTLVKQEVVDSVGYPREDFFMMFEDIEYSYRIRRAGFNIGVLSVDLMRRANLGSRGDGSGKSAWRTYYKARNHLRMALESRSPVALAGCTARLIRLFASALLSQQNGPARARMLLAGVRDGVRGRMGRTVEPPGSTAVGA